MNGVVIQEESMTIEDSLDSMTDITGYITKRGMRAEIIIAPTYEIKNLEKLFKDKLFRINKNNLSIRHPSSFDVDTTGVIRADFDIELTGTGQYQQTGSVGGSTRLFRVLTDSDDTTYLLRRKFI